MSDADQQTIARHTVIEQIDDALVLLERGDIQAAVNLLAVLHFGLSQDQALYHRAFYESEGESICH